MRYATPDDPGRAPIWENYIFAQATIAVRGHIPVHALAYGVEVHRNRVRLRFQMTEVSERDQEDIDDTVFELERLVGPAVSVEYVHEIRRERVITPHDGVSWIYLSKVGDEIYGHPDSELDARGDVPPGEVSALVARVLFQASDYPLSVQDVDELIERSLLVHDAALRRSLGTGVVCELVLSGYVEVRLPDGVEPQDDSDWGRVKEMWSVWKSHNLYPPENHPIAAFDLTPAGWDVAIRIGSSGGAREFVWDGEPYVSHGRWRLLSD